jgi:hypothetical protein
MISMLCRIRGAGASKLIRLESFESIPVGASRVECDLDKDWQLVALVIPTRARGPGFARWSLGRRSPCVLLSGRPAVTPAALSASGA